MNEQFLAGVEDYMDYDDFRKAEIAEKIKNSQYRLTPADREDLVMYLTGKTYQAQGVGRSSKLRRNKTIAFKFFREYQKDPSEATAIRERLSEAEDILSSSTGKYSSSKFKNILNSAVPALVGGLTGIIESGNSGQKAAAQKMLDSINLYNATTAKYSGASNK